MDDWYSYKVSWGKGVAYGCHPCRLVQAKEYRDRRNKWETSDEKAARYKYQLKYASKYKETHKAEIKISAALYRLNNADKIKEKSYASNKKYREANKEKVSAAKALWFNKNKEKIRKKEALYRENNKEKIKESRAVWRAENKDKLKAEKRKRTILGFTAAEAAKRRALKRLAMPVWADQGVIKDFYVEAKHHQMVIDHIVPLVSDMVCGLHWEGNMQLLTAKENGSKGNRYWEDM